MTSRPISIEDVVTGCAYRKNNIIIINIKYYGGHFTDRIAEWYFLLIYHMCCAKKFVR